jgi:hypothetical protein
VSTATAAAAEYTGTFPGTADQLARLRQQVARHLGDCPITDHAVLVASELAANAILHSRSRGGSKGRGPAPHRTAPAFDLRYQPPANPPRRPRHSLAT